MALALSPPSLSPALALGPLETMDQYSVQYACVGALSRLYECADELDHIVHSLPNNARRHFGEALLTVLCRPSGGEIAYLNYVA